MFERLNEETAGSWRKTRKGKVLGFWVCKLSCRGLVWDLWTRKRTDMKVLSADSTAPTTWGLRQLWHPRRLDAGIHVGCHSPVISHFKNATLIPWFHCEAVSCHFLHLQGHLIAACASGPSRAPQGLTELNWRLPPFLCAWPLRVLCCDVNCCTPTLHFQTILSVGTITC